MLHSEVLQSMFPLQNPFSIAIVAMSLYFVFAYEIFHILRLNSTQSICYMFDGIQFLEHHHPFLHFDVVCDKELFDANLSHQCVR